jgi:HSP20 family protein
MVDFRSLVPWRARSEVPAPRDDWFDPFVSFRREMDRMFDSFFDAFSERSGRGVAPFGRFGATPALDIAETDKELVITAEVPGVSEKDVEVTLSGDLLTIKGEKKAEQEERDGGYSYMERRFGSFSRSVRLPFEVKDETVDAQYDKGILTIHIPKPADLQKPVRRIEVKAS